jgi:hypothetical protein
MDEKNPGNEDSAEEKAKAFQTAVASISSLLAVTDKGLAYMVELLECLYHLKTLSQIPDLYAVVKSIEISLQSFEKHFQVLYSRFQSLAKGF